MKVDKIFQEFEKDPEYLAAKRELKPYLELANEILDLRLERGWSQSELARRAGTKQANISRLENGLANPTIKILHKLADAFGTELEIRLKKQEAEQRVVTVEVPVYLKFYYQDFQVVGPTLSEPQPPTRVSI